MQTAIAKAHEGWIDELLVEIAFPPLPSGAGWSFMEFARRHGDYALIGVAAWIALDDRNVCREARLVYLNAGNGPIDTRSAARLLQGREMSLEAVEAAVDAADREIDPTGNVHCTPAYQRHLARVLTRQDHGVLKVPASALPRQAEPYAIELAATAQNAYGAPLAQLAYRPASGGYPLGRGGTGREYHDQGGDPADQRRSSRR